MATMVGTVVQGHARPGSTHSRMQMVGRFQSIRRKQRGKPHTAPSRICSSAMDSNTVIVGRKTRYASPSSLRRKASALSAPTSSCSSGQIPATSLGFSRLGTRRDREDYVSSPSPGMITPTRGHRRLHCPMMRGTSSRSSFSLPPRAWGYGLMGYRSIPGAFLWTCLRRIMDRRLACIPLTSVGREFGLLTALGCGSTMRVWDTRHALSLVLDARRDLTIGAILTKSSCHFCPRTVSKLVQRSAGRHL